MDRKLSELAIRTAAQIAATDRVPLLLPGASPAADRNATSEVQEVGKRLAEFAVSTLANVLTIGTGDDATGAWFVYAFHGTGLPALAVQKMTISGVVRGTLFRTANWSGNVSTTLWVNVATGAPGAPEFTPYEADGVTARTVAAGELVTQTIAGVVRLFRAAAALTPPLTPPYLVPAPTGTGADAGIWEEVSPTETPGVRKIPLTNAALLALYGSGGTLTDQLYAVTDAPGGEVTIWATGPFQLFPIGAQNGAAVGYDPGTNAVVPFGNPLTPDQQAAITSATAPTGSNPFATMAQVPPIAPFVVRDGLTATGYATFIEARNAALAGDRIECYTDCTMPGGVVNEVWMPGYVLTLPNEVDISANITARRLSGQALAPGPIFQPGNITITGYLELNGAAALSTTTNLTLIGGGVVGLICQPGTVVTLQDGHFTSLTTSLFEGSPAATAYLKNASISGNMGTTVPVIDLDNRLRSTPVPVPASSVVAYVLDLTALPFAECIFINGTVAIDSIIGYNMPHVIRITGSGAVGVNIVQEHLTPNDVAGWGQFVSGAIVTGSLRVDNDTGFMELRRKQDTGGLWYWSVENSLRGL